MLFLLCGPEQDKVPRQSVKVFLSENNHIVFGASFEKDFVNSVIFSDAFRLYTAIFFREFSKLLQQYNELYLVVHEEGCRIQPKRVGKIKKFTKS